MLKHKYICPKCNEVSSQDEINQATAIAISKEISEIGKIEHCKDDACFSCPKCGKISDGVYFKESETYKDAPRFMLDKNRAVIFDTLDNKVVCRVDIKKLISEDNIQELLDLANR